MIALDHEPARQSRVSLQYEERRLPGSSAHGLPESSDAYAGVLAAPAWMVCQGLGFVTRDARRRMVHDYSDGGFELDPRTLR